MAFDISTAKPVDRPKTNTKFDISTAKPVDDPHKRSLYSNRLIPQLTKGLYEKLPFGKRVVGMLPNAEIIKENLESTPPPQSGKAVAGRILGETAPDLAMMSPFLASGMALKAPLAVKTGVGLGSYEATKGALQGENPAVEGSKGFLFGSVPVAGFQAGGKLLKRMGADYVTKTVVPRAYTIFQDNIKNFGKSIQDFAKNKLNVSEGAMAAIKDKGYDYIKSIQNKYQDSLDDIYSRVLQGLNNQKDKADLAYSDVMKRAPDGFGRTINVKDTLKEMQRTFRGSLGESTRGPQGQRLYSIMNELKAKQPAPKGFYEKGSKVPTPTQLQRNLRGEKLYDIAGEVRLSKKQFMELRDALNSLYRENPYDRNIARIMNKLYSEGEAAGLKGLNQARAMQRRAFEMEDKFLNRTSGELKSVGGERSLDRYQRLTGAQRRQLKEIEDYTGVKFLDDVDSVTAARELKKLEDYSIDRFASDLMKARDPQWTKYVKEQYRPLLGDKTDDVFKEIVGARRAGKVKKALQAGAILGGGYLLGKDRIPFPRE